jgi:hypothetical protein
MGSLAKFVIFACNLTVGLNLPPGASHNSEDLLEILAVYTFEPFECLAAFFTIKIMCFFANYFNVRLPFDGF